MQLGRRGCAEIPLPRRSNGNGQGKQEAHSHPAEPRVSQGLPVAIDGRKEVDALHECYFTCRRASQAATSHTSRRPTSRCMDIARNGSLISAFKLRDFPNVSASCGVASPPPRTIRANGWTRKVTL